MIRRLLIFVGVALGTYALLTALWLFLIVVTDGSYFECDKGHCAAMYDFGAGKHAWLTDYGPVVASAVVGAWAARRWPRPAMATRR